LPQGRSQEWAYDHFDFLCRQYFKAAYYYLDEPQRMAAGVTREVPNWEEELGPDGGKGAVPLSEFGDHVVRRMFLLSLHGIYVEY
jgi:hypothetical protein